MRVGARQTNARKSRGHSCGARPRSGFEAGARTAAGRFACLGLWVGLRSWSQQRYISALGLPSSSLPHSVRGVLFFCFVIAPGLSDEGASLSINSAQAPSYAGWEGLFARSRLYIYIYDVFACLCVCVFVCLCVCVSACGCVRHMLRIRRAFPFDPKFTRE